MKKARRDTTQGHEILPLHPAENEPCGRRANGVVPEESKRRCTHLQQREPLHCFALKLPLEFARQVVSAETVA